MQLRRLVFPAPFGPMTETISLPPTSRSTPFSTLMPPKEIAMSFTWSVTPSARAPRSTMGGSGELAGDPAVDDDLRARDVPRLVGGEEQRGVRDVPRVAHLPGGALAIARLDHPLHVARAVDPLERLHDHRRVHEPRQDGVGADVLRRVLERDALREPEHGGLARAVRDVRHARVTDPGDRGDVDDD